MNISSSLWSLSGRSAKQTRRESGFTLIEVLVVVAIIALLVAILVPSLVEARDHARSTKCLANIQDMGKGVYTFASGHKDRFQIVARPQGRDLADPNKNIYAYESGVNNRDLLGWPLVLLREAGVRWLKNNLMWSGGVVGALNALTNKGAIPKFELMSCPADKLQLGTFGYPFLGDSDNPDMYYFGTLSYGINIDITGVREPGSVGGVWKDGHVSRSPGDGDHLRGRLEKVIRPSEVMLFVDAGVTNNNPALLSQPGAPLSLGTAGPSEIHRPRGPLLEYVDRAYGLKIRAERHRRGGVNITFADGHGAFVRKFKGNPFNPTNDRSSDVMLPWWRFLPKVRVSPYNSGIYPSAE